MNCPAFICDLVHSVFDPTPDSELERQMMCEDEPKSEREYWAYREIVKLRAEVVRLDHIGVDWLSK